MIAALFGGVPRHRAERFFPFMGRRITVSSRRKPSWFSELIMTIGIAVLVALVFRTFAFEPFNIPSKSMEPTLLVGDFIFVSKYSYGYSHQSLPLSPHLFDGRLFGSAPKRGDVVVFKVPLDHNVDYIKRLVGLPGDHIQVIHRILYINGKPAARRQIDDFFDPNTGYGGVKRYEQYIETLPGGRPHMILQTPGEEQPIADNTPEFVVPDHCYFMMGDNRNNSQDSRYPTPVGFVPEEDLIGRAEIRFMSIDPDVAHFWEFWEWPWAVRFSRLMSRLV